MNKHASFLMALRGCAAGIALFVGHAAAADPTTLQAFVVDGKALQTKPANADLVLPMIDGLLAYDSAVIANGGKPPQDAKARLDKLKVLAGKAAPELMAVAKRLQAANETAAFNRYIAQEVAAAKAPGLSTSFKAVDGDAHAVLLRADRELAAVLSALAQEVSARDTERLFALLGIGSAEAGFACSAVHFAVWAAAKLAGSQRSAEKIESRNRENCQR
jgi:hypothetical protein